MVPRAATGYTRQLKSNEFGKSKEPKFRPVVLYLHTLLTELSKLLKLCRYNLGESGIQFAKSVGIG